MKTILFLLSAMLIAGLMVIKFSAVRESYWCPGSIEKNGDVETARVFFQYEHYRWWVHLWSDGGGMAWLEVPNRSLETFGVKGERILSLHGTGGNLAGTFSEMSGALQADIPVLGYFSGVCEAVDGKK